jgi:hypothetical protein
LRIRERRTRVKSYALLANAGLAIYQDGAAVALAKAMAATMEERLDELLAKAREVGHLANEAARLEHAADSVMAYDRPRARRQARAARKARERAEKSLADGRARFLASLLAVEAAA